VIYRSNLTAPDLAPNFKHLVSRPMGHSFSHDVPSDWGDKAEDDPLFGLYKRCGMWTHDEAAILYNIVKPIGGVWLDIGAHTGWTSAHIWAAGGIPCPIDPMFGVREFRDRFAANTRVGLRPYPFTSQAYFRDRYNASAIMQGAVIDGDHEPGKPLEDAQNCAKHITGDAVLVFHDFIGRPVREAVEWLMERDWKARVYFTPHVVACCWRGDYTPPVHVPDAAVAKQLIDGRMRDFDFTRCE
jgi:hypothetical protein